MRHFAFRLFPVLIIAGLASATDYYVSPTGNDSLTGTSQQTAWRSLQNVNGKTFSGGDRILFGRGGYWQGICHPKGCGNSSAPITIDAYGTGSLPIINGHGDSLDGVWGGELSSALYFLNQQYWTIRNLEVQDSNGVKGARRDGICFNYSSSDSTYRGIVIQNCTISEIDGIHTRSNQEYYHGGGIVFASNGSADHSLRGVTIDSCRLIDVDAVGIRIDYSGFCQGTATQYCNAWVYDLVVKNTTIERTGGDGIIMGGCIAPVVSYVRCLDAGILGDTSTDYIAGIWPVDCDSGGLVEHCEVARTRRFTGDGEAFDVDNGCSGTFIFQYNYTHDNLGGFILDCTTDDHTDSIVCRYNISVNDSMHIYCRGCGTVAHACHFYNNVFFNSAGVMNIADYAGADAGSWVFENNIFNLSNAPNWKTDMQFDNNCYFPIAGPSRDVHALTGDPQFISPGVQADGMSAAASYELRSTSPCIFKGKEIPDNGGADFWGTPLNRDSTDVGAWERPATTPLRPANSSAQTRLGFTEKLQRIRVYSLEGKLLFNGSPQNMRSARLLNDFVYICNTGRGVTYMYGESLRARTR